MTERLPQGMQYVGDFLLRDPVGAAALIACLAALLAFRKDLKARAVASGVILYVLYIVWIGGDFMSGRFFAAPVFVAVAESVRVFRRQPWSLAAALRAMRSAAVVLVFARLLGFDGLVDAVFRPNGIADERRYYSPALSLSALHDGRPIERLVLVRNARKLGQKDGVVLQAGAIGLRGYFGGPSVHILDVWALGDPLLSRLPAASGSRIGHFVRRVPPGYRESLLTGEPRVEDPDLNRYLDALWSVTRGPLWSTRRLAETARFVAGHYDPFKKRYLARSEAWHRKWAPTELPAPDQTIAHLFEADPPLDVVQPRR